MCIELVSFRMRFKLLLMTVVFVCMSWLILKASELNTARLQLAAAQREQLWVLQQCRHSRSQMSRFVDCDGVFALAQRSFRDILVGVGQWDAFGIFSAIVSIFFVFVTLQYIR